MLIDLSFEGLNRDLEVDFGMASVATVNGKTGVVVLTPEDIGAVDITTFINYVNSLNAKIKELEEQLEALQGSK